MLSPQTLSNSGGKGLKAGEHNFTYTNLNLLGMKDTFGGLNFTAAENGTAAGSLTLVSISSGSRAALMTFHVSMQCTAAAAARKSYWTPRQDTAHAWPVWHEL